MPRPAFAHFAQQYFAALLNDFGTIYLNEPVPRDPKLRVYKFPSRSNFGTALLGELTTGNDRVMISPEVVGEASLMDVLFEPDPDKSRASLGLLGELLFAPAIIETLRWTPDNWAHRTCMSRNYSGSRFRVLSSKTTTGSGRTLSTTTRKSIYSQ